VEKRTTDFFELVETGTPIQVQEAIKAGADLKAQANYGRTPLMAAARYNQNPKVITVLLAAGADVNALNIFGGTPLMYAAEYNPNPDVITTLLRAGADAKAKDNAGKTAFDYAKGNEKRKGTDAYRQLQRASQ
jgi:ankyrin repeat protein